MKNLYSFRKVNLLTLTSLASIFFLFSCSEDNYEEDITSLEATSFSESTSSSSVKLNIPTMTASATKSGYPASNANDDSYSTKWRADGTGINLIADLGATKSVDYIKVSHSSGTSRVYSFELWTRESSSSNWVTHGHYTSPGNSSSTVEYDLSDLDARFVRLKCNGNDINSNNEVKKFEVWGSDSGTPPSNNGGTSGSGTFELDEFGIETTTSCSSGTSTFTDSDTELSDGEKYTNGGLDYYERDGDEYILTSCDIKSRRTEWKQDSEFALNGGKKMSYTAKFEDYPSDGVTIGQVHNRGGAGRPLLRAEIAHGKIEFIIVDTHVKDSGNSYTIVGPSYTEGSYLDLSLEAVSDKIIAKVTTTSGTKTVTYTKTNTDVKKKINSVWFTTSVEKNNIKLKDGFYFKAGVYNDSGNGSDSPIATFSEFKYED